MRDKEVIDIPPTKTIPPSEREGFTNNSPVDMSKFTTGGDIDSFMDSLGWVSKNQIREAINKFKYPTRWINDKATDQAIQVEKLLKELKL